MAQQACGPRVEVTPPPLTPYRHGLFSVATPTTLEDGNWHWGVRYRTTGCYAETNEWPLPCRYDNTCNPHPNPEPPQTKKLGPPWAWILGDPFAIYAGVHCMPGADFAAEAATIARDRLTQGEQCAAEYHLWTQLQAAAANPDDHYCGQNKPVNITPPQHLTDGIGLAHAIGLLETHIIRRMGGYGVLHIPAELATYLDRRIIACDRECTGPFKTLLGTPVVLGACYTSNLRNPQNPADPTSDTYTLYATGPVQIYRGPISSYEGIDQRTNDYASIAERVYAVTTDCLIAYTTAARPCD
ncbi:hypothetical protein [Streptomyces noursei]